MTFLKPLVLICVIVSWDIIHDKILKKGPSKKPEYEDGHGSCVAGIAAAKTNNKIGIAGVAPGCRIMPIKMMDFSGVSKLSTQADAINYVAEYAKKHSHFRYVINRSWGGDYISTSLRAAISNARDKGIFMCFVAGIVACRM